MLNSILPPQKTNIISFGSVCCLAFFICGIANGVIFDPSDAIWNRLAYKLEKLERDGSQAEELRERQSQSLLQSAPPVMRQSIDRRLYDRELACDFVEWWLSSAMDYRPSICTSSHKEAYKWADDSAAKEFNSLFFPPRLANAINAKNVNCLFRLGCISPVQEATDEYHQRLIVTGTFVLPSAKSVPIALDFTVRRDLMGLRIESCIPTLGKEVRIAIESLSGT